MIEANELAHALLRSGRGSRISPEMLEHMGKQAAARLTNESIPLVTSIVKMAAENGHLTNEQIKRVCEAANTAVYLSFHEKQASAGAESSYPQFELANPTIVIRTLDSRANPVKTASADLAYSQAPKKREVFTDDQSMTLLADMFGVEKNAEAQTVSIENAAKDLISVKQDLESLRDKIRHDLEANDLHQKEAGADYYTQVKNHLLEGNSFSDVLAAARSTGAGDEKIASVMKPLVKQLMLDKVASPEKLQAGVLNLEKVAHRVVNERHPLVSTFGAVVHFGTEIEKLASGLQQVEAELENITSLIEGRFYAPRR